MPSPIAILRRGFGGTSGARAEASWVVGTRVVSANAAGSCRCPSITACAPDHDVGRVERWPPDAASSLATSPIDGRRRSGALASAVCTTIATCSGTSGARSRSGVAMSVRIEATSA